MIKSVPNLEVLIKEHSKEIERLEKKNAELEFYKSLIHAVKSCGGSWDWITPETTIQQLADTLAVNDVRFHCIKQSSQIGV